MGCSNTKSEPPAKAQPSTPSTVTPSSTPDHTPTRRVSGPEAAETAAPLLEDQKLAPEGDAKQAPPATAAKEEAEVELQKVRVEEPEERKEAAEKEALLQAAPTEHGLARTLSPQEIKEEADPPVKAYFKKFAGAGVAGPPRPPLTQTGFSFMGSFVGIAVLGLIHQKLVQIQDPHHFVLLIAPFGAMAVLVFGACKAPLAQPKNAILGNTIGGVVGWAVVKLMGLAGFGSLTWVGAALSVSLTIILQEMAGAVHPPGGATALCYVIILPLRTLDVFYIFCPAFFGACVLVFIGMFTNNLSVARAYPQTSWVQLDDQEQEKKEGEASASAVAKYFKKFAGAGVAPPPSPPLTQSGFSFMGSWLGIAALALIDTYLFPKIPAVHLKLLIGSFGAMAVLVFSATKAPLAQPKNAIMGNAIGGLVGVCVVKALALAGLGSLLWLNAALAVSLTIVIQELTGSVHPPGGATALIYVVIPPVRPLGFLYVLSPAFLGAVVLVSIGLFTNNLSQARAYPQGWW